MPPPTRYERISTSDLSDTDLPASPREMVLSFHLNLNYNLSIGGRSGNVMRGVYTHAQRGKTLPVPVVLLVETLFRFSSSVCQGPLIDDKGLS